MGTTRQIIFFVVYFCIFSLGIYYIFQSFYETSSYEEQYVEPLSEYIEDDDFLSLSGELLAPNKDIHEKLIEKYKDQYQELLRDKVAFYYIPRNFDTQVSESYTALAEVFLFHEYILAAIDTISVKLYKHTYETRGRMREKSIHMYGVTRQEEDEFLSVLVHEFAHYYDIYTMRKTPFGDRSNDFYDISWESVETIKKASKIEDFVSGYAMTNQYEDFAESYIYFVFHNKDFIEKARKNEILAKKYVFMRRYVFEDDFFYEEDFSKGNIVEDYYWDITKIPFDIKNFLQYMQQDI